MSKNRKYLKDQEIEKTVEEKYLDAAVEIFCKSVINDFEAKKRVADFALTVRGHRVSERNWEYQPGGLVGKCDSCGMSVKIPENPKEGEDRVFGRAVELNCPAARKGKRAFGYADMPPDIWSGFLKETGRKDTENIESSFSRVHSRSFKTSNNGFIGIHSRGKLK